MILISFPALISCLTQALKGCERQLRLSIAHAASPPRSVLAPEETEWGTVGESSPTLKMRKGNRWTTGSTDLVLAGHFSLQTVPEAGKTSLPHHLNSEPKGQ